MFAVVVTFTCAPGCMEAVLPLMRENARRSLDSEAGCHRFDVLCDPSRPGEILLYELYTDRAAFDDHLRTAHFLSFDDAISEMIAHKDIRTYEEVFA